MFHKNKIIKIFTIFLIVFICISLTFINVKIKAKQDKQKYLIGKTIYIDAGHGGKDNGASVDEVMEDQINLKISGHLVKELLDLGAYVLMSRTNDYDLASLYQKNRKREDMHKRIDYINSVKPDLFISIHLNTFPSEKVIGAQVFYQNNENSKALANSIQTQLNVLSSKQRKTKIGDYYILNKTLPTGVLVECGFLSNSQERALLNTDEYQMKLADKIKNGIVNYFSEQY